MDKKEEKIKKSLNNKQTIKQTTIQPNNQSNQITKQNDKQLNNDIEMNKMPIKISESSSTRIGTANSYELVNNYDNFDEFENDIGANKKKIIYLKIENFIRLFY